MGVEEARSQLGRLMEEIADPGGSVALPSGAGLLRSWSAARVRASQADRNRKARGELSRRLVHVRREVKAAGLDLSLVEEALAAVRPSIDRRSPRHQYLVGGFRWAGSVTGRVVDLALAGRFLVVTNPLLWRSWIAGHAAQLNLLGLPGRAIWHCSSLCQTRSNAAQMASDNWVS
jgi:hypothetical protein